MSPVECSHKKRECKQQQQKDKNELHEMIMKQVQQSRQDMLKQSHQHHHLDENSNIDESHQVELVQTSW